MCRVFFRHRGHPTLRASRFLIGLVRASGHMRNIGVLTFFVAFGFKYVISYFWVMEKNGFYELLCQGLGADV